MSDIKEIRIIKMPTKIYYINRSNGKVGSYPIINVQETKQENEKIQLEFLFEAPAKYKKHKVDYYLYEAEWIEDVKKL